MQFHAQTYGKETVKSLFHPIQYNFIRLLSIRSTQFSYFDSHVA